MLIKHWWEIKIIVATFSFYHATVDGNFTAQTNCDETNRTERICALLTEIYVRKMGILKNETGKKNMTEF